MTNGEEKDLNCLKYRVMAETFIGERPAVEASKSVEDLDVSEEVKNTINSVNRNKAMKGLGSWGHEYVKRLTHDIITDWHKMETLEETPEKSQKQLVLLKLVEEIVPFFMAFNAETDACDLLMELDRADEIYDHIDKDNVERVCLYLKSCEPYVAEGDNVNLLKTVLKIYKKLAMYPQAMYRVILLKCCFWR